MVATKLLQAVVLVARVPPALAHTRTCVHLCTPSGGTRSHSQGALTCTHLCSRLQEPEMFVEAVEEMKGGALQAVGREGHARRQLRKRQQGVRRACCGGSRGHQLCF